MPPYMASPSILKVISMAADSGISCLNKIIQKTIKYIAERNSVKFNIDATIRRKRREKALQAVTSVLPLTNDYEQMHRIGRVLRQFGNKPAYNAGTREGIFS